MSDEIPTDEKAVRRQLMTAFLEATALGDALGATTEFQSVVAAFDATLALADRGFPFIAAGGGWLRLAPGAHTDDTDMALAIAHAFVADGDKFTPLTIRTEWQIWLASQPPDVGMLTRATLAGPAKASDPYAESRSAFHKDATRAPNGALMRNAIICAMANDLPTAFEWSLKQGIITHYHPQSVICCAIQVWLIWETFAERWPFQAHSDWLEVWHKHWTTWLQNCTDADVQDWLSVVNHGDHLSKAMDVLYDAEFDADIFDPFRDVRTAAQGWVITSLEVAVWAMQWSKRTTKDYPSPPVPSAMAEPIFNRRGHNVIGWIPLIGRDSDTYGAIAGPMIAAAMGKPFPKKQVQNLAIRKQLSFLEIE